MRAFIFLLLPTLAAFALPGICLTVSLKLERCRYLFILTLSLGLFGACLAISGNFDLGWGEFAALYAGAVLLLIIVAAYSVVKSGAPLPIRCDFRDLIIGGALFLAYGLYIHTVGPYDEVPADFYRHLERVQLARSDLLDPGSSLAFIHSGLNDYYWYYLYAIIWRLSGATLAESIVFFSWFNGAVFLVSLYLFSKQLLLPRWPHASVLALGACLFFVLHHGLASFSYLRYYALSPTLLSMPAYFLVVLVFIRAVEVGIPLRYAVAATLGLAAPLLYHYQEAAFALVMIWLLSLYYSICRYRLWLYGRYVNIDLPERFLTYAQGVKHLRTALTIFAALTGIYIALHLYAYNFVPRTGVDHYKVISLGHLLPFFKNLYILDPTYQFYQTITLWGVVVYIGFLFMVGRFSLNPYLFMGMASPLFTVFNPVFVDLFLRVRDAHALYRFGYMIPMHIVAACLVYLAVRHWSEQTMARRSLSVVLVALLATTLFTFDSRFVSSRYSRIPTLSAVEESRSARHWQDLLSFLNTLEQPTTAYTDPVTGYLITAYTHHQSFRYKFTESHHRPINFDSYENLPLKQYRNGLLVINLRDGGYSEAGKVSGHWPADVLAVSDHYSNELIEHVNNHPMYFPLIWSSDDIRVYRIHPAAD